MAGPWEKYQQPAASAPADGPWMRYQQPVVEDFSDVTTSSSTTANRPQRYKAAGINPNIDATTGESFLDNALAGFGSSYVDLKDSAQQLLANNAARVTGAVRDLHDRAGTEGIARDMAVGLDQAVDSYRDRVQAGIDDKKRNDQALNRTGGGLVGGGLGLLSQLLLPGASLKVAAGGSKVQGVNGLAGLASRAFMPSTIRGSAAQGLALGAAGPVASDESRTANALLGGAFGAGGAALGKGIGAAYRAGRNALAEVTGRPTQNAMLSRLAEIIRSEATNKNALMTPQPSAIPGVQRSLAEETLDSGIARLERLLRSKGGTWGDVDRANNSSRVNALAQFAGDDASIAAAEAKRQAVADPLISQARRVEGVDSKPVLNALNDILKEAEGRPAIQSGLSQIGGLLRRTTEGAERVPEDRLSVLYNVRKTIGDMLEGKYGGESAAALAGSRELMRVKEALDEAMTAASPEFGQYLSAFREGSIPIGRMQIGRELMERGGAVPDAISGETVLTPAQFSRATSDLDRVAARATGFNKAEAARYLQPEDLATINAIQDDLQRRAFVATAGSGGNSQTAERLMGNDRLSRGFANRIAARIPGLGAATEYLREVGQQRLEGQLAEALMNPERARSILASVPADDRKVLQIALTRAGNYVGAVTAQSSE